MLRLATGVVVISLMPVLVVMQAWTLNADNADQTVKRMSALTLLVFASSAWRWLSGSPSFQELRQVTVSPASLKTVRERK